ncbi:WAT1-related protein At1g43650-like [Neltuma alba]|uniref:WAT1-related protein At1g43650-like n=1 Tax=Neltuma alba TaxID=207710 RepID=UPI0010A399CC|nr:WAT1-related protein At1g43650-like [Prosopis alba]
MKSSLMSLVAKYKAYLAMVAIQFITAGLTLLAKAAMSKGLNPYVFVVYRQAFAAVALFPFTFLERNLGAPLSYKLLGKIFLLTLVGLTLGSNLFIVGLNYSSATFTQASTNTVPVITFILAVIFRVESLSLKHLHGMAKILGSILCLSGAIIFGLVKGPPVSVMKSHPTDSHSIMAAGHSQGDQIKGLAFLLSGTTALSLWLVLQGLVVKQYVAKVRMTCLQCFFCCIQSSVLAVIMERDPSGWKLGWNIHLLSVVYSGVIGTGVVFWLQLCSIEEKGAVFTAMFIPLSLVITASLSTLIWKEPLRWGSIGGTVLLVVGLYVVLWGKNRESKKVQSNETRQEEPKDKVESHETTQEDPKEDTTLECSTTIQIRTE